MITFGGAPAGMKMPRISTERQGNTLVITKSRLGRLLTLTLALFSLGGALLPLILLVCASHRLSMLESIGVLLLLFSTIYSSLLRFNRWAYDTDIVLTMKEDSVQLNEYQIMNSNIHAILIVEGATRYADWTYKIAIVDASGRALFLAWFVEKASIDLITNFILEYVRLPIRKERTSWSYRFKDIIWNRGLWRHSPPRA